MRLTNRMSAEDYYIPEEMAFGESYDQYTMKVIQDCCVNDLCSNLTFNISCGEYVYIDQNVSFWQVSLFYLFIYLLFIHLFYSAQILIGVRHV